MKLKFLQESSMLPEKLPKPPYFSKEKMTEQDWKYYFDCRKKFDKPIPWDENVKLADKYTEMRAAGIDPEVCSAFLTKHNYAAMPKAALSAKHVYGFKFISKFNLYYAKQEYPEEF